MTLGTIFPIRIRWALRGLLLFAVCLGLAGPVAAQPRDRKENAEFVGTNPKFLAAFRDSVARAVRSTVRVRCEGKDVALGTVVAADGWILTKASQLDGEVSCRLGDGRDFEARLVGVHEASDLAMLKIEAKGLTPVTWQDSKGVPVGNWVATPGTGPNPVAVGVLSVTARKIATRNPVKNAGFMGIAMAPPDKGGVKIAGVQPGSGADRAGLKAEDRILAVNGKPAPNFDALRKAMGKTRPGDVVTVRVKRGEKELEMRVTLGKRPPDRGDIQNSMGSQLSDRRDSFPLAVQHDTVLRATDCGGPLVDLDGKVIGVNIARGGRTESFAIPSEAVRPLLADLQSGKLAPKEDPAAKTVARAKAAVEKARADLAAASRKLDELKAALKKAEADRAAADKKITEARQRLQKAEARAARAKSK